MYISCDCKVYKGLHSHSHRQDESNPWISWPARSEQHANMTCVVVHSQQHTCMLSRLAAYAHGAWRDQSCSFLCHESLQSKCEVCLSPLCAKYHALITMVQLAVCASVIASQNHDYQNHLHATNDSMDWYRLWCSCYAL